MRLRPCLALLLMIIAFTLTAASATLVHAQAAAAPTAAAAKDAANAKAAPAAGKVAPAPGADPEKDGAMNLLELLVAGGPIMILIALTSVGGVTIIAERLMALRRSIICPPDFLPSLRAVFRSPADRDAALAFCRSKALPIARIVASGIRKMPHGVELVEQAIEDAGANEVAKLRRNLRMLFGLASIAPLLGLLGTVWGLIEAFQTAATEGLGGGAKGAQMMAQGIYVALVTTVAGLSVAIPLLVFYYHFQGRIERVIGELNDVSEEFVEHFMPETQVKIAPSGSPASPASNDASPLYAGAMPQPTA